MRPGRPDLAGPARRIRRPRSLRLQIVQLTAAATAVAMLLLTVVVQLVLAQVTDNDATRVLEDRSEAVVSAVVAGSSDPDDTDDAVTGRGLVVPDSVLDPGVAVFDSSGTLVAGEVPRRVRGAYEDAAATSTVSTRTTPGDLLVRAQPFTTPGGAAGVVVVAEDLSPYEEAERLALIVSLVTGALATGASAAIASWATTRALRPVAEMSRTAADWSEHDLSRRFGLGAPSNEITELAQTLDQLLEKVSTAIRSEQRLTSELAHELRTPLTAVQGTADLMLLRDDATLPSRAREDLAEIAAASRRMADTITTLLDLARSKATLEPSARCELAAVLSEAASSVGRAGVAVVVDEPPAVLLALPARLAVRTLLPVLENAVRLAGTRVALTAYVDGPVVEVRVADDGPGVDPGLLDTLFEPGRSSGGVGTSPGTGLGLAISRRLARSAGGEVDVVRADRADDGPGATFVVRLPRA